MDEKEKETLKKNQETTITLVVLAIIYVFIAVNSDGHDLFELMTSFYSFLIKQLGDFFFLILAIITVFLYSFSLYVWFKKDESRKIDFDNPITLIAIPFILGFSVIIWSCYCTAPLCLLFMYLTLKDKEKVYNILLNLATSEEKKALSSIRIFDDLKKDENELVRQMMKKDTSFAIDVFKSQLKNAFLTIKSSISNKLLNQAELFISDGLYCELKRQINNLENKKLELIYKNIEIQNIALLRIDHDQNFDNIAATIKYTVDYCIKSRLINNAPDPVDVNESAIEIWYLNRKKGVKTSSNVGILANCCPLCKTKINDSISYKCPTCGAILNSGENDWILTEIYKYDKYKRLKYETFINDIKRRKKTLDTTNLKEILKYDSYFSIDSIIDKLKYMFWNLVEGIQKSNKNQISSFSTNIFCETIFESSIRNLFISDKEIELYSTEVDGMFNENGQDYLVCNLNWGIKQSDDFFAKEKIYDTVFVLTRSDKIKTNSEQLFCSRYCPNCGAKQMRTKDICYKCELPVNDMNKIWLLSEIFDAESSRYNKYIEKISKLNKATKKHTRKSIKSAKSNEENIIENKTDKNEKIDNIVNSIFEEANSTNYSKEISSSTLNDKEFQNKKEEESKITIEDPIKTEDNFSNINNIEITNNNIEIKKVEIPNNLLGNTSLKVGSNIEIEPVSNKENITINTLSASKVNIEKTEIIPHNEEPKQPETIPQTQDPNASSLLSSQVNSTSLLGRIDISSSNLGLSNSLSKSSLLSSSIDIKPLSATPSEKKDSDKK